MHGLMALLVAYGPGQYPEDKRPKAPSFDSPKFLSGAPSAMLQGPRKKLKVMKVEIIGKPVLLVR
jgi:hypothetical protein